MNNQKGKREGNLGFLTRGESLPLHRKGLSALINTKQTFSRLRIKQNQTSASNKKELMYIFIFQNLTNTFKTENPSLTSSKSLNPSPSHLNHNVKTLFAHPTHKKKTRKKNSIPDIALLLSIKHKNPFPTNQHR